MGGTLGTLTGAKGGELFSRMLQKFAGTGNVSAAAIGRMASQEPDVVQKFLQYLGKEDESVAPVLKPSQAINAQAAQNTMKHSLGDILLKAIKHGFDVKAAEAEGYSEQEISDFIMKHPGKEEMPKK